ncbi:DNA polymerase III subunit delta' [Azotosporobacter soli]|uniref:DNA polymerase III subunit delta' n=1 Tax=Azotosporobacter soli TaxID=3055040 RepID=UPI0031FE6433
MTKTWQDIIGHDEMIKRLQAMTKAGRRPHAFLFSGPSGIGKALVAETFAAALLCQAAETPCTRCLSCRQMRDGVHPDYLRIMPDGASIKIEQIRMLQKETALAPYSGGCRVVVIDGAETMTAPAANSLLKTLEEPEGDSVFILLTSAKQSMLPTVLSRCMQLSFNPLALAEVETVLTARGIRQDVAITAARLSGGRLGRALLLAEPEGLAERDAALEWLKCLGEDGVVAAWSLATQWDKAERPLVLNQLAGLALCLRDLMMLAVTADGRLLINADRQSELKLLLPRWREETLAKAWQAVGQAQRAVTANANLRLTAESLLLQLEDLME